MIHVLPIVVMIAFCAQPPPKPSAEPQGRSTASFQWKKELAFKRPHGYVQHLTFSPDGKSLAWDISGGKVRLWDFATSKERAIIVANPRRSIHSLVFSPTGVLFAVSRDGRLDPARLWEVSTGNEPAPLEGIEFTRRVKLDFSVIAVAFSPDGKFLALGGSLGVDSRRYVVRILDGMTLKDLFQLPADFDRTPYMAFLRDGKRLAIPGSNECLKIWDLDTKQLAAESPRLGRLVLDGKAVLADDLGKVSLFDFETGKRRASFELGGSETRLRFQSLSTDGTVWLAAGYENESQGARGTATPIQVFRWWDLSTGRELGHFRGKLTSDWINAVSLSPDGKRLAIGSGADTTVWVREKAKAEK